MIRALSRRGVLDGTAESAKSAALPAVYAATRPDAQSGRFYGPADVRHLRGAPAKPVLYSWLRSPQDGRRLWELSERLVGVDVAA